MLYRGEFRSLSNKLYTVEVVTNNDTTLTVPMELGPTPFSTSMDRSSDTMYTPIKATSATIQFVGTGYQFSLYSASAKQNPVTLYDASSNVVWTGYTQPNAYSVPYDFLTETYTVECLDALGILQYYDYELIGESKDFVTFYQIINSILTKTGCITRWYFSKATSIPEKQGNLLELLTISEANFFDEDDEPMKMDEVLQEICKYLNVTAVCCGSTVYFIDYDAIKAGDNRYYFYVIGSSNGTSTEFSDQKTLASSDYRMSGSKLTLDNTYSKVTVSDSLYSVDSILPSMFEDDDLVNVQYQSEDDQRWTYEYSSTCHSNDHYFNIKSRFYNNDRFNHYYYTNTGAQTSGPIYNGITAESKLGVQFTKFNIGIGDSETEAYSNLKYGQWDNYLMLPINDSTVHGKIRLSSKLSDAKPFFTSSNVKLLVKGNLILTDRGTFGSSHTGYFPDTGNLQGNYDGWDWLIFGGGNSYAMTKSCLTLKMRLNLGNTSGIFNVPFYDIGKENEWLTEDKKHHEIFYTSFDVQNSVVYTDKIDEEGYKLNLNIGPNIVIAAKPTFDIYGMDAIAELINLISCAFIKDFDIVAAMPHEGGKDENETDTEYSYDIDEDYVSELGKIEFKICTWDNKQLNYSAVAYPTNGVNYAFLDTVYNSGTGETVRPEQQLCYRIVHQYSGKDDEGNYVGPSKKLEMTLTNELMPYTLVTEPVLGIEMIVDSMDVNYITDSAEINLIEKK